MIVMNDNLLNKIKFQKYILMEGRKGGRKEGKEEKEKALPHRRRPTNKYRRNNRVRKVSMMQKTVGHSLRSFI